VEKRRRLGRGLEDISHYFISPQQTIDQKNEDSTCLRKDEVTKCQALSIVDILDPHRSAHLTSRIGVDLCKNGIRTLIIDADTRFPSVAFMLGLSIPGYSLTHYSQDQYQPTDMVYTGPFGLKLLAPRLSTQDVYKMKMSDVSLIFTALGAIEREIDIVILRQHESTFQPLIEEAVFIIPAFQTGMIRVYREVKSFVSGADGKKIGILIADAADEVSAIEAYEKIYRCIEMSCGIKPYSCGYLSDMATFSVSNIVGHISEIALGNRGIGKERRLFFERLRYLIGIDNLTTKEMASLQG